MSYSNGPKVVTDGLYLYYDFYNKRCYDTSVSCSDLIRREVMGATGTTINESEPVFFENGTNSFYAGKYIKQTYNDPALRTQLTEVGISAFVWFNNTSLLSELAPTYYRQTPCSFGTDSHLGAWNFERVYTSPNFSLRYKFDQEPTYGSTISFGAVELNMWTQLGFTLNSTSLIVYKNGTAVGTLNTAAKTLVSYTNTSALGIAASTTTTSAIYGFIGFVSAFMFYRKKLNRDEILQNYNATKGRFGL